MKISSLAKWKENSANLRNAVCEYCNGDSIEVSMRSLAQKFSVVRDHLSFQIDRAQMHLRSGYALTTWTPETPSFGRKLYLEAQSKRRLDLFCTVHDLRAPPLAVVTNGRRLRVRNPRCSLPTNDGYHVTLELCTFAGGSIGPSLFISQRKSSVVQAAMASQKMRRSILNLLTFIDNDNSYIDSDLFLQWIARFCAYVAEQHLRHGSDPGQPYLLLMDNYHAHLNPAALLTAMVNNIIICPIPPHNSHLLQPNDDQVNLKLRSFIGAKVEHYYGPL